MAVGIKSKRCPKTGRECDCIVNLKTEQIECRADEMRGWTQPLEPATNDDPDYQHATRRERREGDNGRGPRLVGVDPARADGETVVIVPDEPAKARKRAKKA